MLTIWTANLYSQSHNPSYIIYNSKGKKTSYRKMIKKLTRADIVFFGEYHDNPIAHWLELEVFTDLNDNRKLSLGLEMFESDQQGAVDKYTSGEVSFQEFNALTDLWSNYDTDYDPLIKFAMDHQIPVVATNSPRRYANQVYKGGFSALNSLSEKELTFLPPLPIAYDPELPSYVKMKTMMGGHGGDNLPKAQAIKDATMAYFILQNHRQGELFYHINGSYHSDYREGILYYIQLSAPNLEMKTISSVSQQDISKLDKDHLGKADYIICIPDNMTKTYRSNMMK